MQQMQVKPENVLILLDETIGVTPDNVKDHLEHVAPCIRTSPFTYDRFNK
ncbi:Uncharacterised protein [Salmonella enterica subsp. arizonae]|nr:Uncharacterised protein [Salmonella enterica subsp. arizonae]